MKQNQPIDPDQRNKGCIFLIILAVGGFLLLKSCFSSDPIEDKASKLENLKIKAFVYSQNCVEDRLKAPTTADFPTGTEGVVAVNDSLFTVNSYVDSQNGFGAMIRTRYKCDIVIVDENHYRCQDVILFE